MKKVKRVEDILKEMCRDDIKCFCPCERRDEKGNVIYIMDENGFETDIEIDGEYQHHHKYSEYDNTQEYWHTVYNGKVIHSISRIIVDGVEIKTFMSNNKKIILS